MDFAKLLFLYAFDAGDGLVAKHAYAVLGVRRVRGQKFVLLRNSFGPDRKWCGPWSAESEESLNDPATAEALEFQMEDRYNDADAEFAFWMSWEDFSSRISHVFYFRSDFESVKGDSIGTRLSADRSPH